MEPCEELALRLAPAIPGRIRDYLLSLRTSCNLDHALNSVSLGHKAEKEVRSIAADPRCQQLLNSRDSDREEPGLLLPSDSDWPEALSHIPDPPRALVYRGDLSLLKHICIAIVGSRRTTPFGERCSAQCAKRLTDLGFVLCSGGAMGIDRAAHEGAPSSRNIAIIASGVSRPGPQKNLVLLNRIARNGLLLSEVPPWLSARPFSFPRRNRLISGLCRAVLLVQVPERSGALITARTALEQGREVWVVAGPFGDERWLGGQKLVREGARLIASLPDMLAELARLPFPMPRIQQDSSSDTEQFLKLQSDDPVLRCVKAARLAPTTDLLMHKLGWSYEKLAGQLLELEINSLIRRVPGERWAVIER